MSIRRKWLLWISLILLPCVAAGCKRDPQVQKKNFADKASSYFQQGKYQRSSDRVRKRPPD